jgi:RNA polymerase sigma-70 factor (ECF subfamily)
MAHPGHLLQSLVSEYQGLTEWVRGKSARKMYFPTTKWTLLAQASVNGETAAREALESLCRRYWTPLYRFIRARGYPEPEAQDLTQEFLLHLLEHSTLKNADRLRGRFRSFLCGALIRFLSDQYDRRQALKRGGGALHLHFDEQSTGSGATSDPGAIFFDREWAGAILTNALRVVEADYDGRQFAVLRQFLPGSVASPTYEKAAAEVGVSVPALKSELHRLRLRFKAIVRQEIAGTVSAPHETDAEMEHLQKVLMDRGNDLETNLKPTPPTS